MKFVIGYESQQMPEKNVFTLQLREDFLDYFSDGEFDYEVEQHLENIKGVQRAEQYCHGEFEIEYQGMYSVEDVIHSIEQLLQELADVPFNETENIYFHSESLMEDVYHYFVHPGMSPYSSIKRAATNSSLWENNRVIIKLEDECANANLSVDAPGIRDQHYYPFYRDLEITLTDKNVVYDVLKAIDSSLSSTKNSVPKKKQ